MRKHSLWMGALAISALALGCGHGNSGTQGAAGTSGSTDVSGGRTMTLRGCVEAGSPGGTYVLRPTASEGAKGTSGSSGSGAGSDVNGINQQNNQTYRLIATGNLDIGQNIGKEVSVTGELANRAQDNTGPGGTSGSASRDRTQRQGTSGQGAAGTDLESGGSQGSGNGRVQGSASDDTLGGRFFRVTAMTKVSDACPTSGR